MCFVWIWEQTAIISLYNINWLVCITDRECLLRGTDWILFPTSISSDPTFSRRLLYKFESWFVTPCTLVEVYRCFRGNCWFNQQSKKTRMYKLGSTCVLYQLECVNTQTHTRTQTHTQTHTHTHKHTHTKTHTHTHTHTVRHSNISNYSYCALWQWTVRLNTTVAPRPCSSSPSRT